MVTGRIDESDSVLGTVFTIASAESTGVADVTILQQSLDKIWNIGGIDMSLAFMLSALTLVLAGVFNGFSLADYSEEEKYVLFLGGGGIVGMEFIPAVNQFITSNEIISLVALAMYAGVYYAVSYLN